MTVGRMLGRDVGEADDAMLVPGISPMVYSQADFLRIAELARIEAGIVLGERKRMLAYSRLAPLVRRSGRTTFGDYLDLIETDPGEAMDAIAALTTNHTYFNREPHHFAHFEAEVRPALVARASAGGRVRLWSAVCSSGEEVWTLMMVLLGEDRGAGRRIADSVLAGTRNDRIARTLGPGEYHVDVRQFSPGRNRYALALIPRSLDGGAVAAARVHHLARPGLAAMAPSGLA
ncbi:MAG: CheR family methyltransferase [Erythrobacter sp.]